MTICLHDACHNLAGECQLAASTVQAEKGARQRCACAAEHGGSRRYMFLGPDGGHHRNSNYARCVLRPACDGRHPPANRSPARLVMVDATAWPSIPVASWPPAVPRLRSLLHLAGAHLADQHGWYGPLPVLRVRDQAAPRIADPGRPVPPAQRPRAGPARGAGACAVYLTRVGPRHPAGPGLAG